MKNYQLILLERHPDNHVLRYQLTSDGQTIIDDCSYAGGYQHAVNLMVSGDTFQEVEGLIISRMATYYETLEGHMLLNWETIQNKRE